MKISIIIPVYNVEKYIGKCLRSIAGQTYKNYEVIIVNDGSMDESGRICDEFAQKYKNFSVIHIPNGGVSNARNTGLIKASGEYVWFIDSDDYIESGALECIATRLKQYNKPDLFMFDATVTDESGNIIGKISSNLPPNHAMRFETDRKFVFSNTSLWNRIYCIDIIKNSQLTFEPSITIAEDLLFNYKYLVECRNVYYEKDALYYYIQRKNSAMSGAGKNKDVQKVFDHLISYYKGKNIYLEYQKEMDYLAIYHYFVVTSIRMIRCGIDKKECLSIPQWFAEQNIELSLRNPYVRKMPWKHVVVFLLLKFKCYGIVSMFFSKL